jgi:osmotically-inducible protein OsmY
MFVVRKFIMKNILFGVLGVVSLAGLVACGAPATSDNEVSEAPMGATSLDTETDPTMADEMPADSGMETGTMEGTPAETAEISDGELETTIQDNLATLYPDTTFEVTSEAGAVTIAGNIPTQEEADYIADWVSEIKGVTEVEVLPSEGEATL